MWTTRRTGSAALRHKLSFHLQRSDVSKEEWFDDCREELKQKMRLKSRAQDLTNQSRQRLVACTRGLVIMPNSIFRYVWNAVLLLLLLATGTWFPFKLAFIDFAITNGNDVGISFYPAQMHVLELVIDCFFYCDVIVNFFLAYHDDRGFLITSHQAIALAYLRGYFLLDVVACCPPQLVEAIFRQSQQGDESGRTVRLLRLTRISRIARLSRIAKFARFLSRRKMVAMLQEYRAANMLKLLAMLGFWVHLLGCGWYLLAALHEDPEETWVMRRVVDDAPVNKHSPGTQWLNSVYFIFTVFTTVGFGDISAMSNSEIVYCCCVMLTGVFVQSLLFSKIINTVTHITEAERHTERQLKVVRAFADHVHLDERAEERMLDHINASKGLAMHYDRHCMQQMIQTNVFPRRLMEQLPREVFSGQLLLSSLFECCPVQDPRLPMLVAVHAEMRVLLEEQVVFVEGDHPSSVFLVKTGTLAAVAIPRMRGERRWTRRPLRLKTQESRIMLRSKSSNHLGSFGTSSEDVQHKMWPYRLYGAGSHCGEWEVIYPAIRRSSLRSETRAEVLEIPRTSFVAVISEFPHFLDAFKAKSRHREEIREMHLERLTSAGWDYQDLAAITIQRFLRGMMVRRDARFSSNFHTHFNQEVNFMERSALGGGGPDRPLTPLVLQRNISVLSSAHCSTRGADDTPTGSPLAGAGWQTELAVLRQRQDDMLAMVQDLDGKCADLKRSQGEIMQMLQQVYLEVVR
mmetsp:Transcript_29675/g.81699  ORF Transcript_29675/g.81699 Transcript_29675/m.81699 type:complete len:743 (-) Transcript_29675:97-2325(-)